MTEKIYVGHRNEDQIYCVVAATSLGQQGWMLCTEHFDPETQTIFHVPVQWFEDKDQAINGWHKHL